ncbi:MAG TPA: hypothetical protein DCO79_04900, partial [Spirochaeta sp.]|nr:hypothetical protein [Spirochaeta sp.]
PLISIFSCVIIMIFCCSPRTPGTGGTPDLTASIAVPLGEFSPNAAFDLSITVFNEGDADSAESRLSIYLSSDSALDSSDTLLTDRDIPSIPASSSTGNIISQSLSSSGTWYIIAFIDSEETVTEQDETNNQIGTAVTINPDGTKDLQISAIAIDADSLNDGGSCNLSAVISNQGSNTVTETFNISFYMSTDSDFTPAGDTQLVEEEISHDFAEKSSMNLNTVITLPDNIDLNQSAYFYAFLDNTDAVDEVDEDNISDIDDASILLIYDDENSSRTYDLIFETYPPTGTVDDENPDTSLTLYDSYGIYIDGNDDGGTFSADDYSEIIYNSAAAGSTLFILAEGDVEGPYAFSVRTGNIELRYYSYEISVDPYEDDDDHDSNVPDSPVPINIGGFSNRYLDNGDNDWFEITLP